MSDRRFTKSDYVSFMTWAHMDEPNAELGIPLYLDSETNGLYMWRSDENPPATLREVPEIGDVVFAKTPIRYKGIVKEYFFAYGWVGLKIKPLDSYKEKLSKTGYGNLPDEGVAWTDEDLVCNYGIDLAEIGTLSSIS